MITGPKTIVHNIKRCIDKAGLNIEEMVIQPLAISQVALTPGEREFGTVLIDMGGGQTSASVMHDNQLNSHSWTKKVEISYQRYLNHLECKL